MNYFYDDDDDLDDDLDPENLGGPTGEDDEEEEEGGNNNNNDNDSDDIDTKQNNSKKSSESSDSSDIEPSKQSKDVAEEMQKSKPGESGSSNGSGDTGSSGGSSSGGGETGTGGSGGSSELGGGTPPKGGSEQLGNEAAQKGVEEGTKKATEEATKKATEETVKQTSTQVASESAAAAGSAGASSAAAGTATAVAEGTVATGGILAIVLLVILAIIVLMIIVTGIFMFLVTMPGMVMDNLKALFKDVGNFLAALFGADTTQMVENERIYATLDYLDDMGWDLKGDGFLTKYYETQADIDNENFLLVESAHLEDGYYIDEVQGVVRGNKSGEDGNEDQILLAQSDFIFTYIMSDNYIYTIKNKNLVTQNDYFDGFLGAIENFLSAAYAFIYKVANTIYGPLYDWLGVTDANIEAFGKGMLVFYKQEKGEGLGSRGNPVNEFSFFNQASIEINVEAGTMTIKRSQLFNDNKPIEYSLDGWTGRYGMPLEFLLAIHKATMKPDLAYDMATSFNTNVNLILKNITGKIMSGYKASNKMITWDQVERVINSYSDPGIVGQFINWLDNLSIDAKEAIAMYDLGLDIIGNCDSCKKRTIYVVTSGEYAGELLLEGPDGKKHFTQDDDEYIGGFLDWLFGNDADDDKRGDGLYAVADEDRDGVMDDDEDWDDDVYEGDEKILEKKIVADEVCDACRAKAKSVAQALQSTYDGKFNAYQPYIESVMDHWYRDVYFIRPQDINTDVQSEKDRIAEANIIVQDYDYEAVMRERWTLYKTYENTDPLAGNFIWYIINKDGKYAKTEQEVKDSINKDMAVKDFEEEEQKNPRLKKDDDGYYYYYVADIDDAKDVGLSVSKKAITMEKDDTDPLEDLGWVQDGSVWSAYEESKTLTQTGYQSLSSYYNSKDDFKSDYADDVYNNVYLNMMTEGNIKQVGEGVRTETNAEIKKMFLQNKYFQYDGSYETAEIITALREKIYENRLSSSWFDINNLQPKYGPLTEDEYNSTLNVTIDGEAKDYQVKNYAGTVTLEQDALNAFSILENTHTLDADYIYRDFKELVVELGYYTKEEMTEGVPRLLSFPIPEIGTAGYPDRTIDKIDNEFGTMVHSKYDIEANKKYTIAEVVNEQLKEMPNNGGSSEGLASSVTVSNRTNTQLASRVNGNRLSMSANQINTTEVGAANGLGTKKAQNVTLDEFLKETRKMCEYMNMVGYDYCVYSEPGEGDYRGECACPEECAGLYATYGICFKQSGRVPSSRIGDAVCECPANHCKHDVHRNDVKKGHYLAATFELSKEKDSNNVCCDRLVKWALQNVGLIADDGGVGGAHSLGEYILEYLDGEIINKGEDLEPGDIIYSPSHIEIVGEKKGDLFVQYNGGHQVDVGASEGGEYSAIGAKSQAASWKWATQGVRLPWAKNEVGIYEGYEGNEAVVSPVTGILLEYDTITRVNLDQKYKSMYEDQVNEEKGITEIPVTPTEPDPNASTNESEVINGRIVEEEVGYAKILVLNKEYYDALEKKVLAYDSSISLEEVTTQDELDDMLDRSNGYLNETLLAYRDMMEDYVYGGIAGYIVTVEGFKPQLPDPDFDSDEDEHFDDETKLPFEGKSTAKYDLTIDDFKVPLSKIEEPGDKIQTGLEKDQTHNVASEKANEKNLVKEAMIMDAALAMEISKGSESAIFIKEGTILGRTYTDREVILSLRGEKLEDYMSEEYLNEEPPDAEKGNTDKIIGNYIRTFMENGTEENGKKTYVEDVEDYMKLDELERAKPNDWELFFFIPFESGPCDDIQNGGPECVGVCSVGETAIGIIQWTAQVKTGGNNIAKFCRDAIEKDPSLCAPLSAFVNWTPEQFADDIGTEKGKYKADSKVKAALNIICETNREAFLALQMEIAKEDYLYDLLEAHPWLAERRSCVQGIVMHLYLWGAGVEWLPDYENATDEEIILKARYEIANTPSTANQNPDGNENEGRAFNEPEIALRICAGELTEEEIEKWVRTKDYDIVGFQPK